MFGALFFFPSIFISLFPADLRSRRSRRAAARQSALPQSDFGDGAAILGGSLISANNGTQRKKIYISKSARGISRKFSCPGGVGGSGGR